MLEMSTLHFQEPCCPKPDPAVVKRIFLQCTLMWLISRSKNLNIVFYTVTRYITLPKIHTKQTIEF